MPQQLPAGLKLDQPLKGNGTKLPEGMTLDASQQSSSLPEGLTLEPPAPRPSVNDVLFGKDSNLPTAVTLDTRPTLDQLKTAANVPRTDNTPKPTFTSQAGKNLLSALRFVGTGGMGVRGKDVAATAARELGGVRQPGESVMLGEPDAQGRTYDAASQPLPTRVGMTMDALMGGNPAGAREHSAKGETGAAVADLFTNPVVLRGTTVVRETPGVVREAAPLVKEVVKQAQEDVLDQGQKFADTLANPRQALAKTLPVAAAKAVRNIQNLPGNLAAAARRIFSGQGESAAPEAAPASTEPTAPASSRYPRLDTAFSRTVVGRPTELLPTPVVGASRPTPLLQPPSFLRPVLGLPEKSATELPAQSDSTLAPQVALHRLEATGATPQAQSSAIRSYLSRNPQASPQQIREFIFQQIDREGMPNEPAQPSDLQTGANPNSPVGRQIRPRTARPANQTVVAGSQDLNPSPRQGYSQPMHGSSAAALYLSHQNLATLQAIATRRGIPNVSGDLNATLINKIVGSLSEKEVQEFSDAATERSRFPRPADRVVPNARKAARAAREATPPPAGTTLLTNSTSDADLQNALQGSIDQAGGQSVLPRAVAAAANAQAPPAPPSSVRAVTAPTQIDTAIYKAYRNAQNEGFAEGAGGPEDVQIEVIHPNGTPGTVPLSQLTDAFKLGYKLKNPLGN